MQKSSGSNLFHNAPRYPYLPPWCLLSSPQVAALLEVTPETLHAWRTLGTAPEAVSTALVRPTQGNPTFFRLGEVKKWASERIWMSYSMQDQSIDFLLDFFPEHIVFGWPLSEQIKLFDRQLESDRRRHRQGKTPEHIDTHLILEWDNYISKQPRFRSSETKYFDVFYTIQISEMPREQTNCLTPRQIKQFGTGR
jgi:hypothetical protein